MPSVSKLSAHIGYLLRMVSNAVSHEFARKVSNEGVTVAEWALLRSLYDSDPIAPSRLAREMGMTKGAISKLVDRLEEKGLIERVANAADRRGQNLSLSAKGKKKVPRLAKVADENDAAFFAVLSGEQQDSLRSLLKALIVKQALSTVPVD